MPRRGPNGAMALLPAFAMAVAAASGGGSVSAGFPHTPTKAAVPARASVRILPGAKVNLTARAEEDGYRLNPATVTLEDGSRRAARLIEFQ